MAIATPGSLIGSISGPVGGTQFASTASGPIVRSRPRRIRRTSAEAYKAKSVLPRLHYLWSTLTEDQRNAWALFANRYWHTNRLGSRRHYTAHETFLWFNTLSCLRLDKVDMNPRGLSDNPSSGPLDLDFTAGGPYNIKLPNCWPTIIKAYISASRPVSTSMRTHFKNYKYLRWQGIPKTYYTDIQPHFDPILGAPAAGEVVSIRVVAFVAFNNASPPAKPTYGATTMQ